VDCPFPAAGPVLGAGPSKVIVLVAVEAGQPPVLVEWELTGASLMRRWGPCTSARPELLGTSLFVDHKTMLEGVLDGSRFGFFLGYQEMDHPLALDELARLDRIELELVTAPLGQGEQSRISTAARVGR
jgi:hypothetical protein